MIWDGDEDLLTSFDGCGAFRPPEVNAEWLTRGGWFHVDQNGNIKKDKCCIQGLLNLFPSGPEDGGFVVVPKSQDLFLDLFDGTTTTKDFFMIPKKAKIWSQMAKRNLKIQKLCLDPGDFVMWDSRAIHCNTPPVFDPMNFQLPESVNLKRLVAYICMTPTRLVADKKVIKDRVQAFYEGTTTSHWPHEFQPSSICTCKYSPPKLSEDQVQLITGKVFANLWKPQKN